MAYDYYKDFLLCDAYDHRNFFILQLDQYI